MRLPPMTRRRPTVPTLAAVLLIAVTAGCAAGDGAETRTGATVSPATAASGAGPAGTGSTTTSGAGSSVSPPESTGESTATSSADWEAVLAEADGQTVNWYMYGGDDTLNTFVTGYVADRLASLGCHPEPGEDHRHRRRDQQGAR